MQHIILNTQEFYVLFTIGTILKPRIQYNSDILPTLTSWLTILSTNAINLEYLQPLIVAHFVQKLLAFEIRKIFTMTYNPITQSYPKPVESSSRSNTTFLEDSSQCYPPIWISLYKVVSSVPFFSANSLHIFNLSTYIVRFFHDFTFDKPTVIRYILSHHALPDDLAYEQSCYISWPHDMRTRHNFTVDLPHSAKETISRTYVDIYLANNTAEVIWQWRTLYN